jgi:hypothetical protein
MMGQLSAQPEVPRQQAARQEVPGQQTAQLEPEAPIPQAARP